MSIENHNGAYIINYTKDLLSDLCCSTGLWQIYNGLDLIEWVHRGLFSISVQKKKVVIGFKPTVRREASEIGWNICRPGINHTTQINNSFSWAALYKKFQEALSENTQEFSFRMCHVGHFTGYSNTKLYSWHVFDQCYSVPVTQKCCFQLTLLSPENTITFSPCFGLTRYQCVKWRQPS